MTCLSVTCDRASNHQLLDYWRAHHIYYVASQPRTSDCLISHWRELCLLAHDNRRCSIQPRFSLIKILPEPGFDLGSTAGESRVLTARLHMHITVTCHDGSIHFNEYFIENIDAIVEEFPILQSTLPNNVCPEIHTTCETTTCQFLEFTHVTLPGIKTILAQMNVTRCPLDPFSTSILIGSDV